MKKRNKYIKRCKETLWKRLRHGYLVALRDKNNVKHKGKMFNFDVGDVLMTKGEENNRKHWKIEVANQLYIGTDNIIPLAQLCNEKELIG